jgi:hypothetical protein
VSGEEAGALARLFGPDDCFGLAWTLVHLIESAPEYLDHLPVHENEWISRLRATANSGTYPHGVERKSNR